MKIFPASITGCALCKDSPSTLGQQGWNKVMVTGAADQRFLPGGCGTFLLWSARSISRLGRSFLPASQTRPSPVPLKPLSSAPGGCSAATQNKPRSAALRHREAAPDPGRHFPLHSQNRRPPCQHRSGNAATEASPPPGTAWDVPELREGAEPRAARGAHVCQKYRVASVSWNSRVEPSSSSSRASWFSPC